MKQVVHLVRKIAFPFHLELKPAERFEDQYRAGFFVFSYFKAAIMASQFDWVSNTMGRGVIWSNMWIIKSLTQQEPSCCNIIQYTYRNKMIVGNENKAVLFNITQDTFIHEFKQQLFQAHLWCHEISKQLPSICSGSFSRICQVFHIIWDIQFLSNWLNMHQYRNHRPS